MLKVKMWLKAGSGAVFKLMQAQGSVYCLDGDFYEMQLLTGIQGEPEYLEVVITFFESEGWGGRCKDFSELSVMSEKPIEFIEHNIRS